MLEWWPDADGPASYCGAEVKRYRATDPEPAAVLQHWRTPSGATVVVCWPMPDHSTRVRLYLRDWAPNADAYLTIGVDWGLYGPSVWAQRGDQHGTNDDEIQWADLARVLVRLVVEHGIALSRCRPSASPGAQAASALAASAVAPARMRTMLWRSTRETCI